MFRLLYLIKKEKKVRDGSFTVLTSPSAHNRGECFEDWRGAMGGGVIVSNKLRLIF